MEFPLALTPGFLDLASFLGIFLIALLLIRTALQRLSKAIGDGTHRWASLAEWQFDVLVTRVRPWVSMAVALSIATHVIDPHPYLVAPLGTVRFILVAVAAAVVASAAATRIARSLLRRTGGDDPTALNFALYTVNFIVWAVCLLVILGNFGVDITALITGLGIGGVAVALAIQNILGDIFSSLSILFDKPFLVGDFIVVRDSMGTVEKVGLKTTRIRSLTGEQLIYSNSELLKTQIRNYRRMSERRVEFQFGMRYDNPRHELVDFVESLREFLRSSPNVRLDRVHIKGFTENAVQVEVAYFFLTSDYNQYMDFNQSLILNILEEAEKRALKFSTAVRFVYLGDREEAAERGAVPEPHLESKSASVTNCFEMVKACDTRGNVATDP